MNAEKACFPNIVFSYDKTIGDSPKLSINENEAKKQFVRFSVVYRGRLWRIEDCEYAQ